MYVFIKPHPCKAWTGFLTLHLCVCLTVCLCAKYLKTIESINFIFVCDLPSDAGRKPFNFEKNRHGLRG